MCFALFWLIFPPATERYVEIVGAYLAACAVVFVVITLVLPYGENVPADGPYSSLPTKAFWSSRIVYCMPAWFVVVLVMGFFQLPLAGGLFVMFGVPGGFLIAGYRWGKVAVEYRQSGEFTTVEPEDWAEARKRMGID
jgi:hypothetical protein